MLNVHIHGWFSSLGLGLGLGLGHAFLDFRRFLFLSSFLVVSLVVKILLTVDPSHHRS
jgi:hypothetical protein